MAVEIKLRALIGKLSISSGVCRARTLFVSQQRGGPPLLVLSALAILIAGCSRPAQTAAAPPPPPFEYVDTWGSHGDGPGQFDQPVAIASDGESIVYVADAASGFIHKFSASGEPRLSFQDDRYNLRPSDIAVDAGAAMYVADDRRGLIVIFFSDGMHHRQLRVGPLTSTRDSMHIAVDPYGSLYVTAKRPFGIRRYSTGLRLLGSWSSAKSGDAAIESPSALTVATNGLVYVSESTQPQIKVFDAQGSPQPALSMPAEAAGAQLTGLAANAKFLFAVSASHPSVYVWTLDGAYKLTGDLSNWIPGAGSTITRKIAVTPANDLLVLDTAAARIFRFRLHL